MSYRYDDSGDDDSEEVKKIKKFQRQKEQFVQKIKVSEKVQTVIKLDSIEMKINQLLEGAEQYATFLLSRHKQASLKEQTREARIKHRQVIADDEDDEEEGPTRLNAQPSILMGGELKDYQLNGLNWLISLYETGINGILADEMGLGKTVQTIAFLAFLKEFKRVNGPHLVVAPKSTLGNWMNEFKRWMPSCRVLKLVALKEERDEIMNKWLQPGKFDVCLTSYEGVNICLTQLKKFSFKYVVIDEAHKIKNELAIISQNLRRIRTNFKLLLSGTPLQNTPHELWSLLNYLLPDLFDSSEVFDKWFEVNAEAKSLQGEVHPDLENRNLEMVQKFHKILRPFMLRRTKVEVERLLPPKKEVHLFVKLTTLQRQIYQNIIVSNSVLGEDVQGEDKTFYQNKLMQLRKVCLHPYLFPEVEDKSLPALGEHLVEVSGKLIVLDKLLKKLMNEQHQVLVFTQFTMMLNILEDYCNLRQYGYCRIDGETAIDKRDDQIAEFVAPKSKKQVFILSTRAGGLGINLTSADTVVIFDSDFNPQMDLQAMDRAHRIGQKNQVIVYRLVTEYSVEEKIIERQQIKLRWDSLMIQQGRMQQKGSTLLSKDELRDITMFGASLVLNYQVDKLTDEDIDFLLRRGEEKTQEMNQRLDKKFQALNDKKLDLGLGQINIFDYFEDQKRKGEDEEAINEAIMLTESKKRRDRKPLNLVRRFAKQIKLQDHHLYLNRERLQALMQKEEDYLASQKIQKKFGTSEKNLEELPEGGLTLEEREEMQQLQLTGFTEWNRQEFNDFISGSENFGRNAIDKIQQQIKTKTIEEVKLYKNAFWSRIDDIPERDKYVKMIEKGEKMLNQLSQGQSIMEEKCSYFHSPKLELTFNLPIYNKFKSKYFSMENDKFLIFAVNEVGYGNWDKLKKKIKQEALFKFDFAFKCKTESELKNRINILIKVLEKEKETNNLGRPLVKQQAIEKPKALQDVKPKRNNNKEQKNDKEPETQKNQSKQEQSEIDNTVEVNKEKPRPQMGNKIIPKSSKMRLDDQQTKKPEESENQHSLEKYDLIVKKVKIALNNEQL